MSRIRTLILVVAVALLAVPAAVGADRVTGVRSETPRFSLIGTVNEVRVYPAAAQIDTHVILSVGVIGGERELVCPGTGYALNLQAECAELLGERALFRGNEIDGTRFIQAVGGWTVITEH